MNTKTIIKTTVRIALKAAKIGTFGGLFFAAGAGYGLKKSVDILGKGSSILLNGYPYFRDIMTKVSPEDMHAAVHNEKPETDDAEENAEPMEAEETEENEEEVEDETVSENP